WPWRTSTRRRSLITVFRSEEFPLFGEAQHVGHGVEARLFAVRPQRRLHRTIREDQAVLGVMRQDEALRGTGEDHAVVARGRAAAQGRKADVAGPPRAGMAVAAASRMLFKLDATPCRCSFAKHQGRP